MSRVLVASKLTGRMWRDWGNTPTSSKTNAHLYHLSQVLKYFGVDKVEQLKVDIVPISETDASAYKHSQIPKKFLERTK